MAQESIRIGKAELSAFVAAIFAAVGLAKDHADEWAKMLVWANLRGTDSHGIIRIPRYIDLIKAKSINAAPNIRVERKEGAAVVLEADRAPSAVAMTRAMTEAMDCARKVHVGMCAARNVTHTGAIGYFAVQAAEAGFIGIAMSASGPMMAYPGTRVPAVSSNPIAFAVPRRNGRPYLLGLLHRRRRQRQDHGRRRPRRENPGRLGSRQGGPRHHRSQGGRDAVAARRRQGRRPVVHDRVPDQPAAVASAHRAGPGELGDRRRSVPQRHGDRHRHRAASAIRIVSPPRPNGSAPRSPGLARADGVDKIMLPGERGDAIRAEREASGIPIPKGTWQRIAKAAQAVGVTPPM